VVAVVSLVAEIEDAVVDVELLEDVAEIEGAVVDAVEQLERRVEPELSLSLGDAIRVSLWPEERKTCNRHSK
jgi:hypothetical protein